VRKLSVRKKGRSATVFSLFFWVFLSFFLCFLSHREIMGSTNLVLSSTLFLLLVGFATSDINQDKAECTDKLIGLAGCLTYVGGEAAAPTMDCCSGLKQVIDKSKRCLCILIKDRDDPSLGLKINVTLALKLPDACKTPTNITECVGEFCTLFSVCSCDIILYDPSFLTCPCTILKLYFLFQSFCICHPNPPTLRCLKGLKNP